MGEYHSIVYTDPVLLTCSAVDGQWDCCHLVATGNRGAVNMRLQLPVQVPAYSSFSETPGGELLGHVVTPCLIF